MSYNITNWKTKKLENLNIPFDFLCIPNSFTRKIQFSSEGGDYFKLEGFEFTFEGFIHDEILNIEKINISGEASGTFKHEFLDNALKQSTGILEAVLIWEGGDSITSLKLNNGKLTETEIEL